MEKLAQLQKRTENSIGVKKNGHVAHKKYKYRLTKFKSNYYIGHKPAYNSICNFEVHSAGLILSGDFCNHYNHISIVAQEVVSITLVRGEETAEILHMSPMHLLSKIGFPIGFTRYFSFHPFNYKLSEIKIIVEAKEQRLELITSGRHFEKLRRNFKKYGYGDRLKIENKDTAEWSKFRNSVPKVEPHM